MTGNTTKVRSLLLTALLVMSVFAGATTFGGTVAADTYTSTDGDENLSDGGIYFQGQQLFVDKNTSSISNLTATDTTYELRTQEDSALEKASSVGDNGNILLDTSSLATGKYYIEDQGNDKIASFEIVEQELSTSLSTDTVTNGDTSESETTLTLESPKRASYDVIVSGKNLDASELESIFGSAVESKNIDEGTVTIKGGSSKDFTLDFSDIDASTQNLTINVVDTEASAEASITVEKAGIKSANFAESSYSVPRGDIVPITVDLKNTNEATVQVGSNESNFNMSVTVEDGSNEANDGQVTFYLNTYKTTEMDANDVIYAASGSGDSVSATWVKPAPDEAGLDSPVAATSGDNIYTLRVDGNGDSTLDNAAALNVESRSTGSAQTWITPSDLDASNATELSKVITQRSSVAYGDHVIVQIKDTSGIYGAINDETANHDDLSNIAGLSMTVEEDNAEPNTTPDSFNTSNDGVSLITDGKNKSLYVLINTDTVNVDKDDLMGEWTATFTVDENFAVTPDENQSVSTSFSVEKTSLEVNNGEDVRVTPAENQTVSGTTNLAPGTSVTLQASSGVFFKNVNDLTVNDDGTFSSMVDFSGYDNGTEFSVTAIASGKKASVDGVLDTNAEDDPTTTTTTTTITTSTTTTTTTTTSTTPGDTTSTTTKSDGQPGFGVAISVVSLLAAALLALR